MRHLQMLKAKLVRDKVEPRDGTETVVCANSPQGHHIALCLKLHEEACEIEREPQDPTEYADLLQVMIDLARLHGVNWDEITEQVVKKGDRKGTFRMAKIWTKRRPIEDEGEESAMCHDHHGKNPECGWCQKDPR